MGFSRQEYCSGLPFPPPGDFPSPRIEPESPALAGGFFTTQPRGKPIPTTETLFTNKVTFWDSGWIWILRGGVALINPLQSLWKDTWVHWEDLGMANHGMGKKDESIHFHEIIISLSLLTSVLQWPEASEMTHLVNAWANSVWKPHCNGGDHL